MTEEHVDEVTCDVSWRTRLPDARSRRPRGPARLDETTRRELNALRARIENVDWSNVPGVSAATAAAFATALDHALEVGR